MASILAGKRVLVTGGTGFIGSRLVEKLILQEYAQVRVLARNLTRAARIARLPVELIHGDITNTHDVEAAVKDCDLVIHAAYGEGATKEDWYRINVGGTEKLLNACLLANVERVIFLSSLMVYGIPKEGDLNETSPRQRVQGSIYQAVKTESEALALQYCDDHGLPVVVLQPTGVYGPYAKTYGRDIISKMKTGKSILVDGGQGLLNLVYIDDVVNAVILAATAHGIEGETFLISGTEPVTWKAFYERFEQMLGFKATVAMSMEETLDFCHAHSKHPVSAMHEALNIIKDYPEIRQRLNRTREVALLRKAAKSMHIREHLRSVKGVWRDRAILRNQAAPRNQNNHIHPVNERTAQMLASRVIVRTDKARAALGFEPVFSFETGMELTQAWAEWANLLK